MSSCVCVYVLRAVAPARALSLCVMCARECVRVCLVCLHVCTCARVCVFVCLCLSLPLCVQAWTGHEHVYMYVCMHIHTHTRTYICTNRGGSPERESSPDRRSGVSSGKKFF